MNPLGIEDHVGDVDVGDGFAGEGDFGGEAIGLEGLLVAMVGYEDSFAKEKLSQSEGSKIAEGSPRGKDAPCFPRRVDDVLAVKRAWAIGSDRIFGARPPS